MNDNISNFKSVTGIKRTRVRKKAAVKSAKKRPPLQIINIPPEMRKEPEYDESFLNDLQPLGPDKEGKPVKFQRKPFAFTRQMNYLDINTKRSEPAKKDVLRFSSIMMTDSLLRITNNVDSDFVTSFINSIPYSNFDSFVSEFNIYISVLENSKLAGFTNLQVYIRSNQLDVKTLKNKLKERFMLFSENYQLFSKTQTRERIERFLYPTARVKTRPTLPPFAMKEPDDNDEDATSSSSFEEDMDDLMEEELVASSIEEDMDDLMEMNEEAQSETFEQLMSILDAYEEGKFMSPESKIVPYNKNQQLTLTVAVASSFTYVIQQVLRTVLNEAYRFNYEVSKQFYEEFSRSTKNLIEYNANNPMELSTCGLNVVFNEIKEDSSLMTVAYKGGREIVSSTYNVLAKTDTRDAAFSMARDISENILQRILPKTITYALETDYIPLLRSDEPRQIVSKAEAKGLSGAVVNTACSVINSVEYSSWVDNQITALDYIFETCKTDEVDMCKTLKNRVENEYVNGLERVLAIGKTEFTKSTREIGQSVTNEIAGVNGVLTMALIIAMAVYVFALKLVMRKRRVTGAAIGMSPVEEVEIVSVFQKINQPEETHCTCVQCGAKQEMDKCLKSKIKTTNGFETVYFCCFQCFEDKNDWKKQKRK